MQLVIRRQNQGSDIFLESDLSLPTRVMAARRCAPRGGGDSGTQRHWSGIRREPDRRALHGHGTTSRPHFAAEPELQQRRLARRHGPPTTKRGFGAAAWKCSPASIGCRSTGHFAFLDRPQRGRTPFDQYLNWIEEWYQWARAGRPHRITDIAIEYLKANRPTEGPVSFLWGDPQPTNLLFLPDGTISGVIDWEMAVLGPPEADLAWWLFFDDLFSKGMGVPRLAGLPDACACAFSGTRPRSAAACQNLDYYDVLAAFRMAIVGMRSADRQIQRGRIPANTTARENAPIVRLLAGLLGEPLPEVGADFAQLMAALGMEASLAKGSDKRSKLKRQAAHEPSCQPLPAIASRRCVVVHVSRAGSNTNVISREAR